MMQKNDDDWVTRRQAAQMLGLHPGTLANWAHECPRRGPKFARVGRHTRYRVGDVRAFQKQCETQVA